MQREEQRRRTRGALLTAAALEFEARGYDATSLAHVADHLGLVRATVHFHFATKEKLAAEIIAEQALVWQETREQASTTDGPALERLRRAVSTLGERWAENPRVRAAARLLEEPLFRAEAEADEAAWVAFVRGALSDGIADGSIRASIAPDQDAPVLVAMARGAVRRLPTGDAEQATRTVKRFLALAEHALRP